MKKLVISILFLLTILNISTFAKNAIHKVVIQVSSNNPQTQNLALNNAVNLQRFYGANNVKIEIVAYGPGLSIMTKKNEQFSRISSLVKHHITFSACMNTMHSIQMRTGKLPVLTKGVGKVPSGVVRIVELEEQGYAYIRP